MRKLNVNGKTKILDLFVVNCLDLLFDVQDNVVLIKAFTLTTDARS